MPKSPFAVAVDRIQRRLKPLLVKSGFAARGRTFNRTGMDGCVHVLNIQMGSSDPPGMTYVPGLRENLHGLFAINLGVYVPEVARMHSGAEAKAWVQDYHCCVRNRLGALIADGKEVWWHADDSEEVVESVLTAIEAEGLPFFERFATRDRILEEWRGVARSGSAGSPPRIVRALILFERGDPKGARALLSLQAKETHNPGHPAYVRGLARRIGVGELDA